MTDILLNQKLLFGLIGGLGLFLFGMKIMSEGLQKVAGDRLRSLLAALTNNRLVGMFVGLAVTAIIQSSSATTVMVVGFVNAGLMSILQAIGVVLGANIGTTITAQLIAFKITHYALPAIGIGAGIKLFSRNKKWMYMGEIVLGFGILFFGLATMKSAFNPVKSSEEFRQLFLMVGDNHLIAVLAGAILTVIVQSSSATIGITIALATSGLLTFDGSVALILGENIGTTITANMAAIGTNVAARRTAFAHFLFNLIGVAYMLALFPLLVGFVERITPGAADFVAVTGKQAMEFGVSVGDKPYIARHIANTHTMFNVINTLVFLPVIGILVRLATAVIPGKDEEIEFHLKYIDNRVLSTPPIAVGQARAEIRRMSRTCQEMLDETFEYMRDEDENRIVVLKKKEELVNLLQREIIRFLVSLSQQSVSETSSRQIASMMRMVNDFERVGDLCENLWELAQRKKHSKIQYSDMGSSEIDVMGRKIREFLAFVIEALERDDKTIIGKARQLEKEIDVMEERLRDNHVSRLNAGQCAVMPGLIFMDMLHNYEKIGDHTFNIAQAIVGEK